MLSALDNLFVNLRQTIDVVMVTLNAEVLREVDNLHVLGDGVLFQECLALAVAEAEEHHVNLVERHLVGKPQIGITDESFVNVAHQIARITL